MSTRTIVILLAVASLSLLTIYYKIGPPKEPGLVRIVAPPSIIASLPIWVGQSEGLFQRHQLKIEVVDLTSSRFMVQALVSGNADVLPAVSLVDLASVDQAGVPALMFARIYSHSRMESSSPFESILTLPDNGISSLGSLAGKRVGVYPGARSEAVVSHFLSLSGVPLSDVSFAKLPPPEHERALLRGEVDAIHLYEPHRTLALSNGKVRELTGSVYAALSDPSAVGVSAVSREFMRRDPGVSGRFLDAWDEAISIIETKPGLAAAVLAKELGLPGEVAERATWVGATATTDTSFSVLAGTIDALQGAGVVAEDFVLERDMVWSR